MYRIAWRSKITDAKGAGGYHYKLRHDAQEDVNRLNRKYKEIDHWVESKDPCEYCVAGAKPYLNGSGKWAHEGGVLCQTPERNCTCHSGSVCTSACDSGKHHEGCGRAHG